MDGWHLKCVYLAHLSLWAHKVPILWRLLSSVRNVKAFSSMKPLHNGGGCRVLHPTNRCHMEMGPQFKVSSEKLEKPGSNSRPLDYKASSFTATPQRLLPLGQSVSNFIWREGGMKVCVNGPGLRWLPCPYMVKRFKNLLQNQKSDDLEPWHEELIT